MFLNKDIYRGVKVLQYKKLLHTVRRVVSAKHICFTLNYLIYRWRGLDSTHFFARGILLQTLIEMYSFLQEKGAYL